MSEWKEIEFAECLIDESISYGIVQPGSDVRTNSVPIIRVQNIKNGVIDTSDVRHVSKEIEEKYYRTRLQGGELLITVVGSVGETAIVPESLKGWNVARAVSVAKIKDIYNKYFIKYLFATEDAIFQMYGNTNDTVQPTLNLKELKRLVFRIPEKNEQDEIAEVLSSLDDKIDLLHRQNRTLEQMAETLFRQWFVEEADEGWENIELSEIADFKNGKTRPKEEGEYPIYGGNGILGYGNDYNAQNESIIIGRVGAYCGSLYFENQNVWVSDNAILCKAKSEAYLYFIYFFLSNMSLNDLAEGSSHPLLTQTLLKRIELDKPTCQVLERFNSQIKSFFRKIESNQTQIRTLTALRDTLLPKLMSGEVRVDI